MKNLYEIYQRHLYLNDFVMPHGKNRVPYSLKKIPKWLIDHIVHEARNRARSWFKDNFVRKLDSKMSISDSSAKYSIGSLGNTYPNNSKPFLATRPNPRAGIGHQLATVLSGLEYAEKLNMTFAFSGLTSDWEIEMGLELSENYKEMKIRRQISLNSWNHVKPLLPQHSSDAGWINNYDDSTLYLGPYDDSKIDLTYGGKILQEKYLKKNGADSTGLNRMVVHVRRPRVGDINYDENLRNLPIDDYLKQVTLALDSDTRNSNIKSVVLLGTSKRELEELRLKIDKRFSLETTSTTGCCDVGAFRMLATCKIMIGSKSGFSYLAALLNPNSILFPNNFWHRVPGHWTIF
jgi:hypothetical protein